MINDGIIPGAFFVSIDKADGHNWTRDEKEIFYQRQSVPELQAAWISSQPILKIWRARFAEGSACQSKSGG